MIEDESHIYFQDYINAKGDQYVYDSEGGKRGRQVEIIFAIRQEFVGEFKVNNMCIKSAFASLLGRRRPFLRWAKFL